MARSPFVLDKDQYTESCRPGRRIPRSIVRAAEKTKDRPPRKLVDHVLAEMASFTRRDRLWFECICVAVKDDDGMSWSAEAVAGALADTYARFRLWCLPRPARTDALPGIAEFVGVAQFLGLACRHKLTRPYISLRSPTSLVALGGLVAVAVLVQIAQALQRATPPARSLADALGSPWFYGLPLLLGAGGLLLTYLTSRFTSRTRDKSIEIFVQKAEELRVKSGADRVPYDDFIADVARELRGIDFPRVVLIDNSERLDPITANVVDRYFRSVDGATAGSELWIVFERPHGRNFSARRLESPEYFGFQQIVAYEQLLLDRTEREELAAVLGRPERAEFTTVKYICRGQGENEARQYAVLLDYRRRHQEAAEPGPLDLLHLLALTADPGEVEHPIESLVSTLSVKSGLAAAVLSEFMRTSRFNKGDYRNLIRQVCDDFASLVVVGDAGPRTIRAMAETTGILATRYADLGLTRPELGHLFWALVWFQQPESRRREPFWARKLAHHFLAARASAVTDPQTYRSLQQEGVKIGLFAADATLRACLFPFVGKVLRTTLDILNDEPSLTALRSLRRHSWEAYSLIGDDDILVLILEIQATVAAEMPPPASADQDPLEHLFVESLAASTTYPERPRLAPSDLRGGSVGADSVLDYARVRAAWLAITVGLAHGDRLSSSDLLREALQCHASLGDATRRALQRSERESEDGARMADLITSSLGVWCHALWFVHELTSRDWLISLFGHATDTPPHTAAAAIVEHLQTTLDGIADLAESAVLLASKLKAEALGSRTGPKFPNFPRDALAREICVVAVATVAVSAHRLAARGLGELLDERWMTRCRGITDVAGEVLECRLPHLSHDTLQSTALMSRIDEIWELCGLLWEKFELHRLSAFTTIRRLQLSTLRRSTEGPLEAGNEPLVDSLEDWLHHPDFTGLMANFAVAHRLSRSRELAAGYVCQGMTDALLSSCGERLRQELARLAVFSSHTYGYDMTRFVNILLEPGSDGVCYLAHYLRREPEPRLASHVLVLMNLAHRLSDSALAARLVEIMTTSTANVADVGVRRELEALLEVRAVQVRLGSAERPDAHGLLEAWRDRKDLWPYAWLLKLLLEAGPVRDEALEEAVALLQREAPSDDVNSYLLLALEVLQHVKAENGGAGVRVSVAYLRQAIEQWTASLTVEANLMAYAFLARLDAPERQSEHRLQVERWQRQKLLRDHVKALDLVSRGRFFSVFLDYFRSMAIWDIHTDIPDEELHRSLTADAEHRLALVQEWQARDSGVLEPFVVNGPGQTVVSARYLSVGHALFSSPLREDAVLGRARERFDGAAQRALPRLLDIILGAPSIPKSIRDVFRSHARRLLDHTPPTRL